MKISRQLKYYRANKNICNKQNYGYRKRLMAIGRYAVKQNLLTTEQLKMFDKFIFRNK